MTRRLMLLTAISRYALAPDLDRPELHEDVLRMRQLLGERFGYKQVDALPGNPAAHELQINLRRFARQHCQPDDYVIVYLAGHGEILENGEHVLLPADSNPDDVHERSIRTAHLAEWMLVDTPLRRLMVILDSCYSGRGGAAVMGRAMDALGGDGSLVVITATRPHQEALPGVLTQAFVRAASNPGHTAGGYSAPALSCAGIVEMIRADPQVPRTQTATCVQTGSGEDLWFLPNPEYNRLLVDFDIDTQERIRRTHAAHLDGRFRPSAQWFTGRHRLLAEVAAWLVTPTGDDTRIRLVTGDPGSGKTAVLGLLATLSDIDRNPDVPRDGLPNLPPLPGTIDLTIYAQGMPTLSIARAIAGVAGLRTDVTVDRSTRIRRLVEVLRGRDRPLTVLIDALDEASAPEELIQSLILPLNDLAGGWLRLLLSGRRGIVPLLDTRAVVLDLDEAYAEPDSIRAYARKLLLESQPHSPYRTVSVTQLDSVTEAVGRAAGNSFLITRIIAMALAAERHPADPSDPSWRDALPRSASAAIEVDLQRRLGPDADKARALLLPLAYAEGAGIPAEGVWPRLASALQRDHTYTNVDISWLRQVAGAYFREGLEADRSVYRLFHQSLAEYLRDGRDQAADQAALAQALTACAPPGGAGRTNWTSAHPYIRRHLATHAARGQQASQGAVDDNLLDGLLVDPGFLLAADPVRLLSAIPEAVSDDARRAAAAFEFALPHLRTKPTPLSISYLGLAANYFEASALSSAVDSAGFTRPWHSLWASWQAPHPHQIIGRHDGRITAIAVGRLDRRTVAISAGEDRTLRTWDLVSGRPMNLVIRQPAATVQAIAMIELDNRPLLVTGGDDATVRVWDLTTGQPVGAPWLGHTGAITAATITHLDDTPFLITAGEDGHLRAWHLHTGAPLGKPWPAGIGWIRALTTITLEGTPLVIAAGDHAQITAWNPATNLRHGTPWHGHTGPIRALTAAYINDEPIVLSGSDDTTIRAWNPTTGQPRDHPWRGHTEPVLSLAVASVTGGVVAVSASGNDQAARVWELPSGRPVGEPWRGHTGSVPALVATRLGERKTVVTGGGDGTVRLWELETGHAIGRPGTSYTNWIRAVAVTSLDGRECAVTGGDDGTIRVFDLLSGAMVRGPWSAHRDWIRAIVLAEIDGRTVVITGSSDTTIRVWDLNTGAPIGDAWHGHDDKVRALAVSPTDPVRIVSCGSDGTVRIWDLMSGSPLAVIQQAHAGWVRSVAVGSRSGRPVIVSGGDDGAVRLWDLATGAQIRPDLRGHTDVVNVVAVQCRGDRQIIVSGSNDRSIRLWDLETGEPIGRPLEGHEGWIRTLSGIDLPDRQLIISGASDSLIGVWDALSGTLRHKWRGHTGWVWSIQAARLAGGPVLVTGGDDATVRVWDLTTGQPVGAPWLGHTGAITAATITHLDDTPFLITAGEDGHLRAWHLHTGAPLGKPWPAGIGWIRALTTITLEGTPLVIAAGDHAQITAWNPATNLRHGTPWHGHTGPIRALTAAYINDEPIVLSGSDDTTIRAWNPTTGQPRDHPWRGHTAAVRAVAVCMADGVPVVVTGSDDATVRVWRRLTRNSENLRPVRWPVSGGPIVAITEHDGVVHLATRGAVMTAGIRDLMHRRFRFRARPWHTYPLSPGGGLAVSVAAFDYGPASGRIVVASQEHLYFFSEAADMLADIEVGAPVTGVVAGPRTEIVVLSTVGAVVLDTGDGRIGGRHWKRQNA
ncbi:caspase family protein [Streptomyces hyaluromycini]|uniref:caspase family protein n=1 Tax=Streptomyces hyaluromycini TaxID=1377993 RepID=UPI000B5C8117|nr:caspase family protein [Streptomyces hyaluromycini]